MQRLGHSVMNAYGVGQVAEGVKNTAFNAFLLFYFNQVLGLSGTAAGLALLLATAVDSLCDPLAGAISDRFVHRWGRRHPFMYASALPLGLSFAWLWQPPPGLGEAGLFCWLLFFGVLVRQSMTLYHVPHMALGAELSDDYRQRTTVVAYRTAYGLLGVALTIGLAWSVFFRATPEFPNGQYDPDAYPPFGIWFGALITVSVIVSALGTHARIPWLPRPAPTSERLHLRLIVRDYREALANASFRPFLIGLVIFFVVRGIQDVLGLYMTTYFWALSPEGNRTLAFAGLLGAAFGIPLWTVVAGRIDKRPTFLAGVGLLTFFVFAPPMAKLVGFFPPNGHPLALPLLSAFTALAAFSAVAGLVVAGSMLADLADEHELASGRRQEGVLFGALAFAVKASSGLGSFLAGLGIDAIGFPRQASPESVDAAQIDALGILYAPGIALLAVIAIAFLSRYRIDRARHAEIVRELEARRLNAPGPR